MRPLSTQRRPGPNRWVVALLLVAAGLTGCADSVPPTPDGYERHETRGVSFVHPEGWTVQAEGDFGEVARPTDLAEDAQAPMIAVAVDPGGSGAFTAYVNAVDTQLGSSGWDTGRFERTEIPGTRAAWVIESVGEDDADPGIEIARTDLIALAGDDALVHLTVHAGPDDESLLAVVVDSVQARR